MLAHELYRYCVVCGCPSIYHKQSRNPWNTDYLYRYECKCKKYHNNKSIMFAEYKDLPDDVKFSILMKEASQQ